MVEAEIAETMEHDTPFENMQRIIHADGNERIVSARGSLERDDEGRPVRMYGTCHDITDVVRAQTAEREAHDARRGGFGAPRS